MPMSPRLTPDGSSPPLIAGIDELRKSREYMAKLKAEGESVNERHAKCYQAEGDLLRSLVDKSILAVGTAYETADGRALVVLGNDTSLGVHLVNLVRYQGG